MNIEFSKDEIYYLLKALDRLLNIYENNGIEFIIPECNLRDKLTKIYKGLHNESV